MSTASQISSTASAVTIPEFNENHYRYRFCGHLVHCRLVTTFAGIFGFLSVCLISTLSLWKFTWTRFEESVDLLALIGFCVFLVSGTFVHLCILLAVKRRDVALLNPSMIFHSFLILIEVIMALTSIGELATDNLPQLDESELLAREILFIVPMLVTCNSLILHVLLKFRKYLRRRRRSSTGLHGVITPVFFADSTMDYTMTGIKPAD